MTTTLYKKHLSGKIGAWEVWPDSENWIRSHTIRVLGHPPTTPREEYVPGGKAGRTTEQQRESRIQSMINAKLDAGYKRTEQEARDQGQTNVLNLHQPMLASKNPKELDKADTVWRQPKLDGMRLIITRQNGELFAYSRRGKVITTVPHILEEADPYIDEGEYTDGELYCHGLHLQRIMSLAKRSQEDTKDLEYHVYDMIDDRPFIDRITDIADRLYGYGKTQLESIQIVPTLRLAAADNIQRLLYNYRKGGYEGMILRNGEAPYHIGKRSNDLVKVKQFHDEEFTVLEVTTGTRGVAVFVCATQKGKGTFRVTAPGNAKEKQATLKNKELWVGAEVTIRHAGLTPYGIPFHPVCLGRR